MENLFNYPVQNLIANRKSVRTFTPSKIDGEIKNKLETFIAEESVGLFGNKIDLFFLETEEIKKARLGTYGFISGANNFVAGALKVGEKCWEDFGYVFQKLILFLTDNELSTCWIGGTFNRSKLTAGLAGPDKIIPAITPVGTSADKVSLREKLIRFGAKADTRKEWAELFFMDENLTPLEKNKKAEYFDLLELVRLAPSASNKQPWRIIFSGGDYHFFLERSKGYSKFTPGIDLQKIDMGIAICHFDLVAKEENMAGEWKNLEHKTPPGWEYIISWSSK